jgi:hypothetical protein
MHRDGLARAEQRLVRAGDADGGVLPNADVGDAALPPDTAPDSPAPSSGSSPLSSPPSSHGALPAPATPAPALSKCERKRLGLPRACHERSSVGTIRILGGQHRTRTPLPTPVVAAEAERVSDGAPAPGKRSLLQN